MNQEEITVLNNELESGTPQQALTKMLSEYRGRIIMASSLGAEDQVLTDMVTSIDKDTRIFTLDTGRMFQESYNLIEKTNQHYRINIEIFFPDAARVEKMVSKKGINLFYRSVENRKECCHVRKIEPLRRALEGMDVWITGLRHAQSVTRINNKMLEWDEGNGLLKLNPLIDWSEEDVWNYIRERNIPYHALHDKGFPSIGCLPCTRAIAPGEDVRAGRWWWEEPEKKECGLHNRPVIK